MTNDNCIFCKIVRRELPSTIIYEDDETLAFMDAMPQSSGHVLVVPKRHAELIFDATADEVALLMRHVHRIAGAIRQTIKPDGLMVAQFNGKAAGMTVGHLHFHLIPRAMGVDLKGHASTMAKPDDLVRMRDQIVAAL